MTRIQLGELSAGRMALEGADLAPGTDGGNFDSVAPTTS